MPARHFLFSVCVLLISAVLVSSQDSSDSGTAGHHGPAPVYPQPPFVPPPPMVHPPQPQHPHPHHDGSGSVSSSGSHSSDTDEHVPGPTHTPQSGAPGGGNSQLRPRRDAIKEDTSSNAGLYVGVTFGVVVVFGLLCAALVVYRRLHRATPAQVVNMPPTSSSDAAEKVTIDHSPYAAERGNAWVALNGEDGDITTSDGKQLPDRMSIVMGRLASHSSSATPVTGILLPRNMNAGYPIEAWGATANPASSPSA